MDRRRLCPRRKFLGQPEQQVIQLHPEQDRGNEYRGNEIYPSYTVLRNGTRPAVFFSFFGAGALASASSEGSSETWRRGGADPFRAPLFTPFLRPPRLEAEGALVEGPSEAFRLPESGGEVGSGGTMLSGTASMINTRQSSLELSESREMKGILRRGLEAGFGR